MIKRGIILRLYAPIKKIMDSPMLRCSDPGCSDAPIQDAPITDAPMLGSRMLRCSDYGCSGARIPVGVKVCFSEMHFSRMASFSGNIFRLASGW